MTSPPVEVFDTGPEIRSKMLELIEKATDYILIDSFLVVSGPLTREVMEALRKRHEKGIRIYVLADSSSRYVDAGEAGYSFFQNAGIPSAEYNPMRIYKLIVAPVMLPRDHRKFWIVDGRVLFLGGANIFDNSLRAPEEGGNIDLMVAVESAEAIKRMIESFVATWNCSSSLQLRADDFPVRAAPTAHENLWLFDQNKHVGRRGVVLEMIEELFAKAEQEVWLVQPYTFVTDRLEKQIRELTGRGVAVHIMLSGEVHSPRFHYASFYGIKDLLEAGARVWVYKAGKGALHAKAIVVDNRWASVGSANLNKRSLEFAKEANLVFGDHESVQKVVEILEELKANCREIDMKEARTYRAPDYYFTWLWMQLAG